jgi:hypothetical protein
VRRLIVVCGQGAFVAAFRNRAEIVLAHVNDAGARAAPAFARPMSPWLSPSVASMVHENRSQGLNGPKGAYYSWPRPCPQRIGWRRPRRAAMQEGRPQGHLRRTWPVTREADGSQACRRSTRRMAILGNGQNLCGDDGTDMLCF